MTTVNNFFGPTPTLAEIAPIFCRMVKNFLIIDSQLTVTGGESIMDDLKNLLKIKVSDPGFNPISPYVGYIENGSIRVFSIQELLLDMGDRKALKRFKDRL